MTFRPSLRRFLCLWFPEWPLQRRLVAQPELERSVFLLQEIMSRGEFVRYANRLAQRRGIVPGMPVSEARTLVRPRDRVDCEPLHPERDRQGLLELALQAEQFSFCVGLEEAEQPECLLLEITGLAHLFGSEASLGQQVQQWAASLRYAGFVAMASTIGQAWAAAHVLSRPGQPAILPVNDLSISRAFPVTALRLSEGTISKLCRLGLETVAALLTLDRPALLRRFGEELLRRLDQFTQPQFEFITPCRPQPRYRVERQLEEGITQPEAIEHLSTSLLEQLLEQLQPWQLGLRHLRGELRLEDRSEQTIDLRVCQPTHDRQHLSDLLRFQWERISLTVPLVKLSWEACAVSPLEEVQAELFHQEARHQARQSAMLINRLVSRLGEEAVVVPQLLPTPIPERSIRWCPVTQSTPEPGSSSREARWHGLDRPPVLFPKLRPIDVIALAPDGPPDVILWSSCRWKISRTWGPERIESGWWQEEFVRRDYYRAETTTGHRLWLFRRLQDGRWFWQGEW